MLISRDIMLNKLNLKSDYTLEELPDEILINMCNKENNIKAKDSNEFKKIILDVQEYISDVFNDKNENLNNDSDWIEDCYYLFFPIIMSIVLENKK